MPPPKRRATEGALGLPHDDEAGLLKVPNEPLGDDPRHHFGGVVLARSPIELQREGEGVGDVFRRSGLEV